MEKNTRDIQHRKQEIAGAPAPSNFGVMGMIALGGVLPVAGSILSYLFLGEWRFRSIPVHSAVEAVGAAAALFLAMLLLMQQRVESARDYRVWVSSGFIGMGLFDLFHAFPQPGQAFVCLHSLAVVIGGLFFAMVWLPDRTARSGLGRWSPWMALLLAGAIGLFSLAVPDLLPAMVEAGIFTPLAKGINITGGVLFVAATVFFVRRYRASRMLADFLFAVISLLLGVSGILFELSTLWDASWWLWHLMRLIAYTIALGYIIVIFQQMREVQQRQVDFLNSVPAPVVAIDREFTVQFINDTGARFAGTTVEAAAGRKCYDLFKTHHCHTAECRLHQAMEKDGVFVGETVAQLDDDVSIQYSGVPTKDAGGKIVGALEYITDISEVKRIQQVLQEHVTRYMAFAEKVGTGDLSNRLQVDAADVMGRLGIALNGMVERLAELAGRTRETTGNITSSIAEILATTNQQAVTTSQQSAVVNQTNVALQEVRQTAVQADERARNIARMAQDTAEVAAEGLAAVNDTMAGMGRIKEQVEEIAGNILTLSEQTRQIGNIVDTVNDIADQSNLLALNAAIESARAGEAGKGFSVVAGEVRSLAEQSRQATAQVREILEEIQNAANTAVMVTEEGTKRTEAGQQLTRATAEAFGSIGDSIGKMESAARQIAASTRQQSAGMDQVGAAMESIDQAASQTETGTRQSEAAAKGLAELTGQLADMVKQYKLN